MTDHKTVREALEFAVELCAMRTDFMNKSAIIYGQRMPIEDIKDCLSNALAALDRIESQRTALQAAPDTIHVQFVRSGNGVFCRKWDFEPFEGSQPVKIGQLVVDSAAYMSYQLRNGEIK